VPIDVTVDGRQEVEDVDTQEAFETLLADLETALKKTQQSIENAGKRSDFSTIQEAAGRGKTIQQEIDRLVALQRRWRGIVGGESVTRRPKQVPQGAMLAQTAYRLPILQALVEMGGQGRTADVLDRVGELLEGQLSGMDHELVPSGTDVRWRNKARWARNTMVKEGLMASDSPHGIWEITESGREVLRGQVINAGE